MPALGELYLHNACGYAMRELQFALMAFGPGSETPTYSQRSTSRVGIVALQQGDGRMVYG